MLVAAGSECGSHLTATTSTPKCNNNFGLINMHTATDTHTNTHVAINIYRTKPLYTRSTYLPLSTYS